MIKKIGEDYYLCKKIKGRDRGSHGKNYEKFRNWFGVRATQSNCGRISCSNEITIPTELVGKRIRLKVEIVELPEIKEDG